MKNPLSKLTGFISATAILWSSKNIYAQGLKDAFSNMKEAAKDGSYKETDINFLASDIVQLVLSVLGVLFVVFMIYAGYLWLTAAGNEQRVSRAKTIIFQSILGLVIVIGAYAISYFVIYVFKSQVNL